METLGQNRIHELGLALSCSEAFQVQHYAALGACSKLLTDACERAMLARFEPFLWQLVKSASSDGEEKALQGLTYLLKVARRYGLSPSQAVVGDKIVPIPDVPLSLAKLLVSATGFNMSFQQLVEAAEADNKGAKVWLQAAHALGMPSTLTALQMHCVGVTDLSVGGGKTTHQQAISLASPEEILQLIKVAAHFGNRQALVGLIGYTYFPNGSLTQQHVRRQRQCLQASLNQLNTLQPILLKAADCGAAEAVVDLCSNSAAVAELSEGSFLTIMTAATHGTCAISSAGRAQMLSVLLQLPAAKR